MVSNSKSFIQKMDRHEQTLRKFIDSPAFKEAVISHIMHTNEWLYEYGQVLEVELLLNGEYAVPATHSWSKCGECIVVIIQVGSHFREMDKIGEVRNFEDVLEMDRGEALAIAERLYVNQEEYIKRETLLYFNYLRERGRYS